MKKQENATEQLRGILEELGETDLDFFLEEIEKIYILDNLDEPNILPDSFQVIKEQIMSHYSGSWQEFKTIWIAFHLQIIAKRLHKKFERIAKKYPYFDTILRDMSDEM